MCFTHRIQLWFWVHRRAIVDKLGLLQGCGSLYEPAKKVESEHSDPNRPSDAYLSILTRMHVEEMRGEEDGEGEGVSVYLWGE